MSEFLGLEYRYPATVESEENVRSSQSDSLRIFTVRPGAQRWEIVLSLAPVFGTGADAGRLSAHKTRCGHHTPFSLPMPQISGFEASAIISPVFVMGGQAAGAEDIPVRTLSAQSAATLIGALSDGTFVGFGTAAGPEQPATHPKVYQVVSLRHVGPLPTNLSLAIYPRLTAAVADKSRLNLEPMLRARYDPDIPPALQIAEDGTISPVLNLVEDLV